MKVVFTRHAKNRMRWRTISVQEALLAILHPDRKELLENNKFHYYKTINQKYLRATVVFENGNMLVISVVDKRD